MVFNKFYQINNIKLTKFTDVTIKIPYNFTIHL